MVSNVEENTNKECKASSMITDDLNSTTIRWKYIYYLPINILHSHFSQNVAKCKITMNCQAAVFKTETVILR